MDRFGKATWIHHLPSEGPDAVRQVARRLAEAGFDAVIPCVKNPDGYADWASRVAKVRPVFADWDPLATLCEEASRVGLQVHAWCCVFPEGDGSNLLEAHPEYVARDPQGREVVAPPYSIRWACSSRPEVQAYELSLSQELLDNYDLAAVHLDYIRYCHPANGYPSCYCDYCRGAFRAAHGADPVEIDQAHALYAEWIAWRVAQITRFVEQLRERANAAGKQVTAAVFPDYPNCVWGIGQDWEDWAKRGLVDVLMPMNYTMSIPIAAKRARNHRCAVNGAVPLWEGLWNREAMTTQTLADQVNAVLTEGAQGVTIFEYFGLSDEDLAALAELSAPAATDGRR
jgi:uncharacterized lipoprotein YddW (UPF0748 family)